MYLEVYEIIDWTKDGISDIIDKVIGMNLSYRH